MTAELLNQTAGGEAPVVNTGADAAASTPTETQVSVGAVELGSADQPTETVIKEDAASTSEPAKAEGAEPAKPETSLLAEAGKEEKPAEQKAEDEAPKEEPKVELPTYAAFTMPEGVEITDQAQLKQFTDLLGEYETQGNIPHELMQEMGQKLVDMYSGALQKLQEATVQRQMTTWNETRAAWVQQIKDDPLIGRNRFDTVLKDAVKIRDRFGGEGFAEMLNYTGAGDHPGMMRFCNNIAAFLKKNGLLDEGQPVPAPAQTAAIPPNGKTGPRARYSAKGA